jgi:hypothetical protein
VWEQGGSGRRAAPGALYLRRVGASGLAEVLAPGLLLLLLLLLLEGSWPIELPCCMEKDLASGFEQMGVLVELNMRCMYDI